MFFRFGKLSKSIHLYIIMNSFCWIAFKYTKTLQFKTTYTLKDIKGHIAVSMKVKEALVYKSAFFKSLTNLAKPSGLFSGIAHINVTGKAVSQTLMIQIAIKAPKLDKINFRILQMIWD